MAGPRIKERYKYMTLPQAARKLRMSTSKLRRRIKDEILPKPTFTNEYGVQFFDEEWIKKVKLIIRKSYEGGKYEK